MFLAKRSQESSRCAAGGAFARKPETTGVGSPIVLRGDALGRKKLIPRISLSDMLLVPLLKLTSVLQSHRHDHEHSVVPLERVDRKTNLRLITFQRCRQFGKRIQVRQYLDDNFRVVSEGHGQLMKEAD
jgi:hypothetical protein